MFDRDLASSYLVESVHIVSSTLELNQRPNGDRYNDEKIRVDCR